SERGNNIVFVIEADGIRLCHLGDLGHFLSETQLAELGRIDILLIPVGGHFTLEPEEAAELAEKISAAITIPMHYKTKNIPDNLPIQTAGPFLQAMQRPHQEVNVLTVSADDLRNRQPEVVTLLAVS
ncbi:MBL fold metallo-hydrolase, partial [Patescibacteria group bacterium]|nr:MBL fold metallo-hydrolase [Patescibacteria group bacterium]